MKFDRNNKFDFCYYGQVNSLRLKSSVASKWASGGFIYFAGDGSRGQNRTTISTGRPWALHCSVMIGECVVMSSPIGEIGESGECVVMTSPIGESRNASAA